MCSPKGGVGKTTITRCLLVAGAQAGLSVVGLDFDPQQSLGKWATRREKTRQALPSETFVSVPVHSFDLSECSLIPSFYTVADWTTICFNLSSRRSISQGLRLNFGGTGMQARTCPRPYRIGA
ncbi:MAG: AAA family ATPase [Rhodopila sp.]